MKLGAGVAAAVTAVEVVLEVAEVVVMIYLFIFNHRIDASEQYLSNQLMKLKRLSLEILAKLLCADSSANWSLFNLVMASV